MKKIIIPAATALSAMVLLTGCLAIEVGGGSEKKEIQKATMGQQLIDLQKAKDTGAITEAEFQSQKTKLLGGK